MVINTRDSWQARTRFICDIRPPYTLGARGFLFFFFKEQKKFSETQTIFHIPWISNVKSVKLGTNKKKYKDGNCYSL